MNSKGISTDRCGIRRSIERKVFTFAAVAMHVLVNDHSHNTRVLYTSLCDVLLRRGSQVSRQRQIDKDLNQTAAEIKAAQADKQAQLNELDVVVSLKLNQLYCMDNALEGQGIGEGANGAPEEGADKLR